MAVRNYEMMAVVSPEVTEEDLPAALDKLASTIGTVGGVITSVHRDSPWGRRRLAYPIRHNGRDVRDGYYALYYFDLESGQVVELERELRLNEQIIRHLVLQQVAPAPQPVPVAEAAPDAEGETAAEGEAAEAPAAEAAESAETETEASESAE